MMVQSLTLATADSTVSDVMVPDDTVTQLHVAQDWADIRAGTISSSYTATRDDCDRELVY